jgi:hypothetical protein
MLLAVAGIGAHGAIARVVSARCSGKRLQVSDICVAQVRLGRKRIYMVMKRKERGVFYCVCGNIEDGLTLTAAVVAGSTRMPTAVGLRGAEQYRVVSMSLDMLLEILRSLEGFAAKVTLMWLQGHVHADVRGDMISLDSRGAAVTPLAGEVEIVGAFTTNMALTNMVLYGMLVPVIGHVEMLGPGVGTGTIALGRGRVLALGTSSQSRRAQSCQERNRILT